MSSTPFSVSEWTSSLHEIDVEPTSPLVDATYSYNVGSQNIVVD
jgi:hypothetical protein